MTPTIAIALITKMKLIFETDKQGNSESNKFLAFQNGAFPVTKENFYFMQPDKYGVGPIDTAIKMFDFSNTFNFVAEVGDFIRPVSEPLQDVYHETLKNAIPASNVRGPEQEVRFAKAIAYLNEPIILPNGETTTNLANYDKYEQLYKIAVSEYKNRSLANLNATGDGSEAVKQQWTNDEPILKKDIERNLLIWESVGKRAEVEKYLGDFLSLSAASPNKTIGDLKLEYELFSKATSIDHLANELNYIPTFFSPINFFEDDAGWHELSLDQSEVQSLVSKAPASLKDLFEVADNNIDINKLSVEYTVVEIIREWLHYSDFLLQRFWKLPDGIAPLADGSGSGRLPAFPQKMIFVRNLKVEMKQAVVEPQGTKKGLLDLIFRKLKPAFQTNMLLKNTEVLKLRNDRHFKTKELLLKKNLIDASSTSAAPALNPVFHASVINMIKVNPRVTPSTMINLKTTEQPVVKARVSRFYKASWSPKAFSTFNAQPDVVATPAPSATVISTPEMELLAFICNQLPQCPSPDLQLNWEG
jgi:hypothetical protein